MFSFYHNVFLSVTELQTSYFVIPPPPKSVWGVYRSRLVGRSVRPSVGRSVRQSVCSFLSALFLINYWTNFIQTSQLNSVSSRDVHMKCWLWLIDFSLSYGPFMKFLVRSFSHQLIGQIFQTTQIDSVSSRDVHILFWLWFI